MAKDTRGGKRATGDSMTAYNTLSQTDREALDFYTMDGYEISSYLRNDEDLPSNFKALQKDLDHAISQGEIKADTKVYRGVSANAFGIIASDDFNDVNFKNNRQIASELKQKIGTKFTDKGYMSTSHDKATAISFSNGSNSGVVMEMNIKKGTKAMHIGSSSGFKNESETLLGRNTQYTLKGVRMEKGNIIVQIDVG